ncbi:VPS10 domain-containing protein [Flavobacterium difficile]|uniref:Glycosyl hydrolase n=1 Tax=Flavobacterium difficile TaxID=2709659 RepID=A0ABX0I700_9FLAO|nr:sialidase family protein [Flavobacterium difficile]NHM02955.1 glycosyl hydrolase [Flavobacterium difficile]
MKKIVYLVSLLSSVISFSQDNTFQAVTFQNIGPTIMSGRVVDLAVNENNPTEFYTAYATGGLWYTNNNGTSFESVMDAAPTQNIGCVAVDWKSGLILVGTGEVNSSRSSYAGIGVLKSTDKGKTWTNIGLPDSHHISKIWVNPNNNDEIVVGVLGHLYSKNEERGVFKTTNGGKTWSKTLYINNETGIIDLSFAPNNPKIMFAAAWERERKAYDFKGNGIGSGIYKSEDAGTTWTKIDSNSGFPVNSGIGRIGLSSFNENIAYAIVDNQNMRPNAKSAKSSDANTNLFETEVIGAEIYKTIDAGKTWKKTHTKFIDDAFYSYGYYFADITVDESNENSLYISAVPLLFSNDGGKSFNVISKDNVHADHHVCWVNPKNPNHVINGNDGGVNITFDNGKHWIKCNNQAVGQFYAINVDNKENYEVYGGLQDNGVWAGPNNYVHNVDWLQDGKYPYEFLSGGDGMQVQIDTRTNDLVYAGSQFGNYTKIDRKSGKRTYITPRADKKEAPYRFNWQTPILLSSHNQDIIYFGGQYVFRSMNQGKDWEKISDDLTNGKVEGNVPFGTITSIAESKFKFGQLVVGTDDGNIHVTNTSGTTWTKISAALPQGLWVSRVRFSNFKKDRIYITLNGYRNDNFTTYVYVSEDLGTTWKALTENFNQNAANVILEDTENENILYLGTDNGLFISIDRGTTWQDFSTEIPNVAVHDLVIQNRERDLIVGTHGRSLYKVNVANIQQINETVNTKGIALFKIDELFYSKNWGSKNYNWGSESVPNIELWYYLKEVSNVAITIKNSDGVVVLNRQIKAEKGMQKIDYDLSIDEKTKTAIEKKDSKVKINLAANSMYYLPVGKYTVELEANGKKETQTLLIKERK